MKYKYFRKSDIVVYAVLALLLVALCFTLFFRKSESLKGIEIFYRGELIYEYDFDSGCIYADGEYVTQTESEGGLLITVETPDGKNVLFIGDNYTKMMEADCSQTAECVNNFDAVENTGDVIICAPHSIKVIGTGDSEMIIPSG
ncbi:MAG: NusG domain II-containing protein [Clostridia bacterium]|nr:NusG domain II-containing protein [Clostridia bacterium]